jgi:hypothetical protein
VAKDTLDEWVYYLKNDEVLKGSKAKGLKEVEEQLRIQALAEGEQKDYYRHMENSRLAMGLLYTARIEGLAEGEAIGEARGEAKGEARGEKKRAMFAAERLKALGMDSKTIADCTGLTVKEVEEL